MFGPEIIRRTLSTPRRFGDGHRLLQYHPRSDHHSKVACWCVVFDLLHGDRRLQALVKESAVVYGINHRMQDFRTGRAKDLDLVLGRPDDGTDPDPDRSFKIYRGNLGIDLTPEETAALDALPDVKFQKVSWVYGALEAKAMMSEYSKARPRLYDELNSSHLTIHGASASASAIGLVLLNTASKVRSPLNGSIKTYRQPEQAQRSIQKAGQLPRRSGQTHDSGFDALGIVCIDLKNDGSPCTLSAMEVPEFLTYDTMIVRAKEALRRQLPT